MLAKSLILAGLAGFMVWSAPAGADGAANSQALQHAPASAEEPGCVDVRALIPVTWDDGTPTGEYALPLYDEDGRVYAADILGEDDLDAMAPCTAGVYAEDPLPASTSDGQA